MEYIKDNSRTGLPSDTIAPLDVVSGNRPETTMTYSGGLLATRTDPNSLVTTFDYDDMGRLVETTYPDSSTEQSLYGTSSESGLVVKTKNRMDTVTYYDYDDSGRLLRAKVGAAVDADIRDGNADDSVVTDVNLLSITDYEYVEGSDSLKTSVVQGERPSNHTMDVCSNRNIPVGTTPQSFAGCGNCFSLA